MGSEHEYTLFSSHMNPRGIDPHRLALDLQAPDLRHLIHNYPYETRRYLVPALRWAAAAGALATTKEGAQPAMPTLAELQALLEQE